MSNNNTTPVRFISNGTNQCAYVQNPGSLPRVFFLGGFNSSMQGLKALALEAHCKNRGIAFTRFDYRGHGKSGGQFVDHCISDWLDDALTVFDAVAEAPQLVVGSSMGAWIGTHVCHKRRNQVVAMLGLAAAPDFTRDLLRIHLNDKQRVEMQSTGITYVPSCYDDEAPYPITRRLVEDGEAHCVLDNAISLGIPVHLMHGTDDQDISWRQSTKLARCFSGDQTQLTLIKGGDHRLSTDNHLSIIKALNAMHSTIENNFRR